MAPPPQMRESSLHMDTDGSDIRTKDDGTVIGSGAYCKDRQVSLRNAPCGDGLTNSIMRAGGHLHCGIPPQHRWWTGSSPSNCIIATDSKASMKVILEHIHKLSGTLSTHRVLLEALTAILLEGHQL